jgi:hypothetical protein
MCGQEGVLLKTNCNTIEISCSINHIDSTFEIMMDLLWFKTFLIQNHFIII